jgi:hypothetical protein
MCPSGLLHVRNANILIESTQCYRYVVYKEIFLRMKRLMVAALGLALLSGTAVFAQNTSTDSGSTMTKKSKHKKKGNKSTDSSSTTSTSK